MEKSQLKVPIAGVVAAVGFQVTEVLLFTFAALCGITETFVHAYCRGVVIHRCSQYFSIKAT